MKRTAMAEKSAAPVRATIMGKFKRGSMKEKTKQRGMKCNCSSERDFGHHDVVYQESKKGKDRVAT